MLLIFYIFYPFIVSFHYYTYKFNDPDDCAQSFWWIDMSIDSQKNSDLTEINDIVRSFLIESNARAFSVYSITCFRSAKCFVRSLCVCITLLSKYEIHKIRFYALVIQYCLFGMEKLNERMENVKSDLQFIFHVYSIAFERLFHQLLTFGEIVLYCFKNWCKNIRIFKV
jgi:hypothetical protein